MYLLIFTCLWSRAINLVICKDLTVQSFMRAFQIHIFSHGLAERVYSDLGTQIVAGATAISDFLKDAQTKVFFHENNVNPVSFNQYFKGCNKLGGLVESCVKLVKRLLFGSIRNLILSHEDFEFLICQVIHLVNRRPVAFKEYVDKADPNLPSPITPEMLLNGQELLSLNVIPSLQPASDDDPDWSPLINNPAEHVRDSYSKLRKARSYLNSTYHEQFVTQLMKQATDVKNRYKPKIHFPLELNDVVLLKEPMLKPSNYPMGIVTKVIENDMGEVTAVEVRKGTNRETVKRHVTSVIPLLTGNSTTAANPTAERETATPTRPKRVAAQRGAERIKLAYSEGKA